MKKFVSKVLAGALGLSMLCGVAAAEGETYVSWYTFGDVYLSSSGRCDGSEGPDGR